MSQKLFSPKECPECKKSCSWFTGNLCHNCYRKHKWKPKKGICPKCNRQLPLHAKGLCGGCYNTTFHLENAKDHNYRKYHNIEPELYRKITKSCLICGFDKVVDLHHLDKNRKNNSETNLIGLCPNHHHMLHNLKYRDEITRKIQEKLNK
jgi:hypothetical protein